MGFGGLWKKAVGTQPKQPKPAFSYQHQETSPSLKGAEAALRTNLNILSVNAIGKKWDRGLLQTWTSGSVFSPFQTTKNTQLIIDAQMEIDTVRLGYTENLVGPDFNTVALKLLQLFSTPNSQTTSSIDTLLTASFSANSGAGDAVAYVKLAVLTTAIALYDYTETMMLDETTVSSSPTREASKKALVKEYNKLDDSLGKWIDTHISLCPTNDEDSWFKTTGRERPTYQP